jgi:endonuclease/exonuclease/phosphatase family metal-dependent hydrolase
VGAGEPLRRSLGSSWQGVAGPGARYLGVVPFAQAVLWRESPGISGVERLESLALGLGRHALVTRVSSGEASWIAAVAHLTPQAPLAFLRRAEIRARQLERLAEGLRRVARTGEPIVLGGDFNYATVEGQEPEHRAAQAFLSRELDLVDVGAARAGSSPPTATWPTAGMSSLRLGPQRLDLFYVSRRLLERVGVFEVLNWSLAESGSDHAAVRLVLDLESTPAGRLAEAGGRS